MKSLEPNSDGPATDKTRGRRQAGFAAWGAAAAWVWLLCLHKGAIFRYNVPADDPLVLVLGLLVVLGLVDLQRSQRRLWGAFDNVCLVLAVLPGTLLIAAYISSHLPLRQPAILANAGWGMLLLFPATMLAASPLARHRILRSWNWLPAMIGLALPFGQFAFAYSGRTLAGLAFALLLAPAWVILGFAARVPPTIPTTKQSKVREG